MYGRYADGGLFFELPIDYPDHEDVEGFFDYVRDMDPVRFVFYLTGRVVPVERWSRPAWSRARSTRR